MSVQKWRRKLSATEYINEAFNLAIIVGRIIAHTPKKYHKGYGDELMKSSVLAIRHTISANDIYMSQNSLEEDYKNRRYHLQEAKSATHYVMVLAYIYLESCKEYDGSSNDKITRYEQSISISASKEMKLIGGVLKSDSKRYAERLKEQNEEVEDVNK